MLNPTVHAGRDRVAVRLSGQIWVKKGENMSLSDELFTQTFACIWFDLCEQTRRSALRHLWEDWLDNQAQVYVGSWGEHDPGVCLIWDSAAEMEGKMKTVEWIVECLNKCPDGITMTVRHAIVTP